jgi:sodium/bile acid cotransporter 7
MGLLHKLEIAIAAAAGALGLVDAPTDDVARAARVATLYADYREEFAAVPDVDVWTLQRRLDAGEPLVLVDVRTEEERAVSTLPGAVAAEVVEADPDAFRGQRLVAYCTIGYRSGEWAEARAEDGLDVTNLRGSVLAWTHTGRALQGPDGETRRVHVYGRTWDLARTDYEAVW